MVNKLEDDSGRLYQYGESPLRHIVADTETLTNKVCKIGFGALVVSVFILGAIAIFSQP